ncbi:hypothetical protein IU485_28080 [Nocardia cyriacigeorgica]|uniref:hypothetical protein n=1 Tax=Nocardia cyriacigeorgica TaxID=135487 RepID=UPI001895EB71|nr:hypothetical protein [Nocardia cyriacigeorgica]MBF6085232.1 hypothetical protein [Nocardia cyriacigeorgica]
MLTFTPNVRSKLYAAATAIAALLVAMNILPTGIEANIETILNSVGGIIVAVTSLMAKLNVSFGDRDAFKR